MTVLAKAWQDITFGARYLWKRPNYSFTALATLVLTVAAVTTMFTIVRHVLLQPLPAPRPGDLVSVEVRHTQTGNAERSESISFATFLDWQAAQPADAELAWAVIESSVLTESDVGVYSAAHFVSHNFLRMIGVEPVMGRWFSAEDAGAPVVAISYDMWQQDLDGDDKIVGRTISIDKLPFTVVGVMPPGYLKFLEPRLRYWRPVDDFGRGGSVIGRLPADYTPGYSEQFAGLLTRMLQREAGEFEARLIPLQERLVASTKSNLWLLMAGVSALFLVAILNLTNLTFAHFHSRAHELTMRATLGATRGRLVTQLLAENLIVGATAAAISIFAAAGILQLALLTLPQSFPRRSEISLDASIWGFALLVAVASSALITLLPSIRIANPAQLIEHLKQGGGRLVGSFGSTGLRRQLIAVQVGLALALLVVVGLLLRSYMNLLDQQIGFKPERVVSGHIWRPEGFSNQDTSAAFDRVLAEIEGLPEVSLVAAGSTIPMGPIATRVDPTIGFTYQGQLPLREGEETRVALRTVTDEFFRVLDVPLLAGRFFDGREKISGNRTLLVNEAMANAVWPGQDAIGQELVLQRAAGGTPYTIVGVVANYRFESLYSDPKPEVFLSMSQDVFGGATFIAKIHSDNTAATLQTIRSIASRLDNSMPMIELHMMDSLVRASVDDRESVLVILLGFGLFATLLAGLGIYGLTSYLIGLQTREIAIRIALGAGLMSIKAWVIRGALIPAAAGVLLGLIVTIPAARLLSSYLFGVEAWDWQAYAGALLVVSLVAVCAPLGPAIRAARVRPTSALRAE
jgi:putative ABC transport system permease protein